jgi:hypothetical protein
LHLNSHSMTHATHQLSQIETSVNKLITHSQQAYTFRCVCWAVNFAGVRLYIYMICGCQIYGFRSFFDNKKKGKIEMDVFVKFTCNAAKQFSDNFHENLIRNKSQCKRTLQSFVDVFFEAETLLLNKFCCLLHALCK